MQFGKLRGMLIPMMVSLLLLPLFPGAQAASEDNTAKSAKVGIVSQAVDVAAYSKLHKIRYNVTPDKTRIVLDLSTIPSYNVTVQENPWRLIITLQNTALVDQATPTKPADSLVTQIATVSGEKGSEIKVVLNLTYLPYYEIFTLQEPNRLVIDLGKIFEQKVETKLSAGLQYTFVRQGTAQGPLAIHIIDYNLNNPALKIEHVLARETLSGIETVSAIAQRYGAVVAVNGTYFSKTGELLGLIIREDEIIQTPISQRTAFALQRNGKMLIDQVNYTGELILPSGAKYAVQSVNRTRGANEIVIYTNAYGQYTRANKYGIEYTVVDGVITQIGFENASIPVNGYVASAHGARIDQLAGLKVGDPLLLRQTLDPQWQNVRFAIGAGPRLIKEGNIYLTTKTEGFGSDVAGGRAPRTALGITADQHLLLVVVDGRKPGHSIGMTLLELAKLLHEKGAVDAMNLDGGGSSELVIDGLVANNPSDGKERAVGDALVIVPIIGRDASGTGNEKLYS